MRMGIALIIIVDLIIRSRSLVAFYTDEGVLPLSVLYKSNWSPSYFSVYVMSTGWKLIAVLFIINFLFALALFFGYKTRLVTFLCWIFLISIHNRNPLILQGGDELLRLILFWGIFLPWGRKYSIDSITNQSSERSYFGIAVIGYLFLLFSVYFFSALLKTSSEWRGEGTALYYALNIDQMAWPLGKWLLNFPRFLKLLTLSTFYIELLAPFLLFIPIKNSWFRFVFILIIGVLHLSISLTLYVGLFYLIGLISLLGLFPGRIMDYIDHKFRYIKSFFYQFFKKISNFTNYSNFTESNRTGKLNDFFNYQIKLLKHGFLFFVICFNLLWCVGNTNQFPVKVSERFHWFAYTFRFDQDWGMFAPSVLKDDGWYIYEAQLESKSLEENSLKFIDLNRNGKYVDYNKPADIIGLYEDDRWRKFGEIWAYQPDNVKKELCRYLKNKWNSEHPEKRISTLKILFMKEVTQPEYKISVPERNILCDCEKW
jgi:hypothetical protein